MTAVGAYEAKTKPPELLRGVQVVERYTITHRGEPIAEPCRWPTAAMVPLTLSSE